MKQSVTFLVFLNLSCSGGVSGGVFQGSFDIRNEMDVETIRPYEEITGKLSIMAPGLRTLDLPNLRKVDGYLEISSNEALTSLRGLHNLMFVGGGMGIVSNGLLPSLDGLEGIAGAFPASVGITNNDALADLAGLGNITSVGSLAISSNPQLRSISFPLLTRIDGSLSIGGDADLGFNSALSNIALDSLTTIGQSVWVHRNPDLASISMSRLTSLGGPVLEIRDNPSLPMCQVLALLNQLDGFAGAVDINSNDDAATCE
jgi:hypothetical protein